MYVKAFERYRITDRQKERQASATDIIIPRRFPGGQNRPCSHPVFETTATRSCTFTWALAGMGKRRHLPPPPVGNVVMCFCAVIVTAKRSDESFIHYFHTQSSVWLLGLRHQTPTGNPSLDTFVPRVLRRLICPPLEKNLAGAHARVSLLYKKLFTTVYYYHLIHSISSTGSSRDNVCSHSCSY